MTREQGERAAEVMLDALGQAGELVPDGDLEHVYVEVRVRSRETGRLHVVGKERTVESGT